MPLTFAASWVPQPIGRYITVAVMPCDCPVTVCHGPFGGPGELGARLRGLRRTRAQPQAAEHAGRDDQRRRDAEAGVAPAAAAAAGRRQVDDGAEQLTRRLGPPWPTAARLAALAGGPSLSASANGLFRADPGEQRG